MKRRDILRKTAAAGAIATGAASVASASGTDEKYVVFQQDGEEVVKPLSSVDDDVGTADHCHTYCCEDCGNLDCNNCVCEDYCHV